MKTFNTLCFAVVISTALVNCQPQKNMVAENSTSDIQDAKESKDVEKNPLDIPEKVKVDYGNNELIVRQIINGSLSVLAVRDESYIIMNVFESLNRTKSQATVSDRKKIDRLEVYKKEHKNDNDIAVVDQRIAALKARIEKTNKEYDAILNFKDELDAALDFASLYMDLATVDLRLPKIQGMVETTSEEIAQLKELQKAKLKRKEMARANQLTFIKETLKASFRENRRVEIDQKRKPGQLNDLVARYRIEKVEVKDSLIDRFADSLLTSLENPCDMYASVYEDESKTSCNYFLFSELSSEILERGVVQGKWSSSPEADFSQMIHNQDVESFYGERRSGIEIGVDVEKLKVLDGFMRDYYPELYKRAITRHISSKEKMSTELNEKISKLKPLEKELMAKRNTIYKAMKKYKDEKQPIIKYIAGEAVTKEKITELQKKYREFTD